MIQPHWYQLDCLKAIQRVRQKGLIKALIVLAGGLGKTIIAAFDVLQFRKMHPNARVLYLCHQNDILRKSRATFEAINGNGNTYGFFHGTKKDLTKVNFLFASLQTMRKHLKSFRPDEFDYIVVDESHRTHADTHLDVVEYFHPKFLLGMTATPNRMDRQDIRTVFGQEVFYLPLEEALAQGLLTPVDYRLLSDEIQLKRLIETADQRLSAAMLNRHLFVSKRDEEIVKIIQKNTREFSDPKTIIFCQSRAYCDHLSRLIDNSMPFHSGVPAEERIIRLEMFRQGMVSTLLVVDVFNEGIDVPQSNVLVFLRSTASPIVYFQQLARGLRISEGKEKVIVLDFVGNCDRVKTVYDLWQEVTIKREQLQKKTSKGNVRIKKDIAPFLLNVTSVQFHEKIVKLMDVVRRITDGYSREEAIDMLQKFAKQLGRSPTQAEVHQNKHLPSLTAYAGYFGTFTDTLKAAGLAPNQRHDVSDEDLILQLRTLAEELGHPPSQRELGKASKAGKCSCEPIYRDRFGSLSEALQKIGLNPGRYVGLTAKELCAQLVKLKEKLGRVPRVEDLFEASARDEIASYSVIRSRFKTWNNALRKAGLVKKVVIHKRHSDSELFKQLKIAKGLLNRLPSVGDMNRLYKKKKVSVSLSTFYSRFGSFEEALKKAGLTK